MLVVKLLDFINKVELMEVVSKTQLFISHRRGKTMLDINLPVTVNIIVTPETCYRGSAQTREGKFFEFELLFNEVEFEAIPLQLTTPKQYDERRDIASKCIKNIIKNAVAAKYHQDVVCDKFELRNPPYFELQRKTTEMNLL